jgi:GNAT superfamily N-acetyltransferase
VLVRQALQPDIDVMVGLLEALFAVEADFHFDQTKQRSGLEMLLNRHSAAVYVAECDSRIVGMCTVQTVISTAEGGPAAILEDLVVLREFRGKGIGKKLVAAVCQWAQDRNIQRVQLLADKDNSNAIEFYEHNGWCVTNLICLRTRIEDSNNGNDGI